MCRTTADVTFHLRDGVKWHDGEPFTSADVAFTLTSLAAPTYKGGADSRIVSIVGAKAYQEGSADSVSGITTPDDKTGCCGTGRGERRIYRKHVYVYSAEAHSGRCGSRHMGYRRF